MHTELEKLAHHGIAVDPAVGLAILVFEFCLVGLAQNGAQVDNALYDLAVLVLEDVDEVQLVAGLQLVGGEIDDDVVTLRNRLYR